MTLPEFVDYVRDAASRFRVRVERANARHPGLYPERQRWALWIMAFAEFCREERKGRREAQRAKTV